MIYIYGLVDPRDNKVKYIGKTRDVELRLGEHIRKCHKSNSPKNAWLSYLLKTGKEPTITILEACEDDKWEDREKWWIACYREKEPRLKNVMPGGAFTDCRRAEKHPRATLTKEQVAEMRDVYRTGKYMIIDLLDLYPGLSNGAHAYNVLCGNGWKSVPGALSRSELAEISFRNRLKGSDNGNSKLTREAAVLVFNLRYTTDMTYSEILAEVERRFGIRISRKTASAVVEQKTWKHIIGDVSPSAYAAFMVQ